MDKFDLKKYIAEGKLLKKEISENEKYEPFVEGETFLRKTIFIDKILDYAYYLKNQEEYDFLLKYGPDALESEYAGEFGIDVLTNEYEDTRKEKFSLGNNALDMDLPQIQEDQSANQLKEDTSKYEPFVEGETFIRRSEFIDQRRDFHYYLQNEEEYNFLKENGINAFIFKYIPEGVDSLYDESEDQYKQEYSLGNDEDDYDLTPIQENKSTK